jgi:cysteine desulfurase family protein
MDLPQKPDSIMYLDNAATVYPKPREIMEPMLEVYQQYGVNPGRSGYDLCLVGGDLIENTRKQLTSFFGGTDPRRLTFAYNASDALNILIQGMVGEGDHVVSTTIEHNSVIRPLNHLAAKNLISVDYVRCDGQGTIDPREIERAFRRETKLVVINHGSNVIGTIQPIAEIGKLCREREILLVVDVAQTAGVVPIDMQKMYIDALAFTGHKSLLGPTGIGGCCVAEGVVVNLTRYGGTGVRSAHPFHLDEYPYRLEVGTVNVLGIVGLHLAQQYLAEKGIDKIYRHEMDLFSLLQTGLLDIEGVTLHGTRSLDNRLPVLSFTVNGRDPADVGTFLDVDHNIATRSGLQCAPLIHNQMGTAPRGTVRMSVGPSNTAGEIETAVKAVASIAAHAAEARK